MLFLITNQSNCFTLFVLKLGGDTSSIAHRFGSRLHVAGRYFVALAFALGGFDELAMEVHGKGR